MPARRGRTARLPRHHGRAGVVEPHGPWPCRRANPGVAGSWPGRTAGSTTGGPRTRPWPPTALSSTTRAGHWQVARRWWPCFRAGLAGERLPRSTAARSSAPTTPRPRAVPRLGAGRLLRADWGRISAREVYDHVESHGLAAASDFPFDPDLLRHVSAPLATAGESEGAAPRALLPSSRGSHRRGWRGRTAQARSVTSPQERRHGPGPARHDTNGATESWPPSSLLRRLLVMAIIDIYSKRDRRPPAGGLKRWLPDPLRVQIDGIVEEALTPIERAPRITRREARDRLYARLHDGLAHELGRWRLTNRPRVRRGQAGGGEPVHQVGRTCRSAVPS